MSLKKVLFVVPLPPPWAGVEQISQLLFHSPLKTEFDLEMFKSNVRDSNAAKGAWNFSGISRVVNLCSRLFLRLFHSRPQLLYMTLSQNTAGLARDIAYLDIARFFGVPVVAHLHGSKLFDFLQSRSWPVRVFLIRELSHLKAMVVCADSIALDLAGLFPLVPLPVVYNACPPTAESSAPAEKGDDFNVAFMGHLSEAKGFYDLIDAAAMLLERNLKVSFHFAGEWLDNERNVRMTRGKRTKDRRGGVEALVKKYPGRFHFHGIITGEKKKQFFEMADVFVLPSYAEAFPVAVLEAMSFGLPLVVTPVGALPEVLEEGRNGFLVRPGDSLALAERIRRLLENRFLRDQMGSHNRSLAEDFSVDRMADDMAVVFETALQSPDKKPA